MAAPFLLSREGTVHPCFLSPIEEHQNTLSELNASVIIHSLPDFSLPSTQELIQKLTTRYGDSMYNWKIATVQGGYLVRVPDWATSDDLIWDSPFWEREWGLAVAPWQTMDDSDLLPPASTVLITISNFPLDYWHPIFFRQATVSMGMMAGFSTTGAHGEDRNCVRILLQCHDTRLIPHKLRVGHNGRWSKCNVHLHSRRPIEEDPDYLTPRSPPAREDRQDTNDNPHRQPLWHYLPWWTRRPLRAQIPTRDPTRQAAPAASQEEYLHRFTTMPCATGLDTNYSDERTRGGHVSRSPIRREENIPKAHSPRKRMTCLNLFGAGKREKKKKEF